MLSLRSMVVLQSICTTWTKASLLGKAPIFPEEDMEQRKKEYLAFILAETGPL